MDSSGQTYAPGTANQGKHSNSSAAKHWSAMRSVNQSKSNDLNAKFYFLRLK
jgi:hypothetical protein